MRFEGKLLSPERRRRVVVVLDDRFQVSQRRACRLTAQHRNTQRRPVPLADIEEKKLRSGSVGWPGAICAGASAWFMGGCGLITPSALIRTGAAKGGYVRGPCQSHPPMAGGRSGCGQQGAPG